MTARHGDSSYSLHAGKLPPELLASLLAQANVTDPSVIVGPRMGEDAALIDTGGDAYLAVTSDPVTFATDELGWYLVHVNANDIAVMGATPRWLLVTLLLPVGTPADLVEGIFRQITGANESLNVALIGGHTEVTPGIDRPLGIGTMIGEVARGREVLSSGVQPGDAIILTKGIGIEGAAVLAREARDRLLAAGMTPDAISAAALLLHDPGISVVRDARIATQTADVHAMHDPTEGGVATGLREMAEASGVGLMIDVDALPVLPETRAVCDALGISPLGLIASGALLAAVGEGEAGAVVAALQTDGIVARIIGRAVDPAAGLMLVTGDSHEPLPVFERDELARFFEA